MANTTVRGALSIHGTNPQVSCSALSRSVAQPHPRFSRSNSTSSRRSSARASTTRSTGVSSSCTLLCSRTASLTRTHSSRGALLRSQRRLAHRQCHHPQVHWRHFRKPEANRIHVSVPQAPTAATRTGNCAGIPESGGVQVSLELRHAAVDQSDL